MAPPGVREGRGEFTDLDHAGRQRRQDTGQRRVGEACPAGKILPRRNQQRAAIGDIAGHIGEIAHRDDGAPFILVEDDKIELIELALEQLLCREGDEGHLFQRRDVLLEGWAQDGEVDEVDRRVGFQEVPPDPARGIRLAGDQKHAQPVAHARKRGGRAVIGHGQLLLAGRGLDNDDIVPAPLDLQRQRGVLPRLHGHAAGQAAIDGDRHGGGFGNGIINAHDELRLLADNAEIWRLDQADAPVAALRVSRDEGVNRAEIFQP